MWITVTTYPQTGLFSPITMKTSNKLLISLLAVGLLTLVGSVMSLRAEHDKIDFNDPFYGFSSTPIKSFSVLKIEGIKLGVLSTGAVRIEPGKGPVNSGDSYTTVGIEAGKTFEIRAQKDNKVPFTHRFAGDTLIVRYEPEFYFRRIKGGDAFDNKPFVYIIAPSVRTLIATSSTCKLAGFMTDKLAITMTNARVLISKSTISDLTTSGQRGSLLQTAKTNRINKATVASYDSTGFIADHDIFGSLALQNDSTATLKIPASLLKKL
jgi:hypothetical protein